MFSSLGWGAVGASVITVAVDTAYRAIFRALGRYATVKRILNRRLASSIAACGAHELHLLADQGDQLLQRLQSSPNYTCVWYSQGSGVSTMVRSLAAKNPAVVYISFHHVKDTRELILRVAQAFDIALREHGSIVAEIVQRLVVALRLKSFDGQDSGDDNDSDRCMWFRTTAGVAIILADCAKALSVRDDNKSKCIRPVVFLDDLSSLDEELMFLLQDWAASSTVAHFALVTNNIPVLLGREATLNMSTEVIAPSSKAAAGLFLQALLSSRYQTSSSCVLDSDICRELVHKITGTRAVDLVQAALHCRQFLEGQRVLAHSTISAGTDHELTESICRGLVRDFFASSRSLHLYSPQRTCTSQDRVRWAIFALSLKLIDLSGCRSEKDICQDSLVVMNFEAVLAVCPLHVFIELGRLDRGLLPFDLIFDMVRFKSPVAMRAMAWVIGFEASDRRKAAALILELLHEV